MMKIKLFQMFQTYTKEDNRYYLSIEKRARYK